MLPGNGHGTRFLSEHAMFTSLNMESIASNFTTNCVCVCARTPPHPLLPSPLTHNLFWIFSTHHSLYNHPYSAPRLDFAFPSIKFNVLRRLALHIPARRWTAHTGHEAASRQRCASRVRRGARAPPSRVPRK